MVQFKLSQINQNLGEFNPYKTYYSESSTKNNNVIINDFRNNTQYV